MKRKKKSTLDRLYSYDKKNNAYKIEISLDKYEDIYNEWDPTPFKKRDIEDMTREISPLKKADDAVEIDTTGNTLEETLNIVMNIINE